jgi:hypothetical protein
MNEFSGTKCQKCLIGSMTTCRLLSCEILEVGRELLEDPSLQTKRAAVDETDLLKVGDMAAEMVGRFRPPVFRLIAKKEVQRP